MGFSGYARLWADREVRALFVAAFFARMPNMAIPLISYGGQLVSRVAQTEPRVAQTRRP